MKRRISILLAVLMCGSLLLSAGVPAAVAAEDPAILEQAMNKAQAALDAAKQAAAEQGVEIDFDHPQEAIADGTHTPEERAQLNEAANAAKAAYEGAVKTALAAGLEIDSDGYAHLPAELDEQADLMALQALIQFIKANKTAWDAAVRQAEAMGVEIVYDEDYEPAQARPDEQPSPEMIEAVAKAAKKALEAALKAAQDAGLEIDSEGFAHIPAQAEGQSDLDELEKLANAVNAAKEAWEAAKEAAEQQGVEIDFNNPAPTIPDELTDPDELEKAEQARIKAEAAMAAAKAAAEQQGLEIDWDAVMNARTIVAGQADLEDPKVIEALNKAEAALAAAKKAAEEQGIEIDWDAVLKLPVVPAEQPCEHDYETVVTAPTCTEAGFTTYTCSKCGDSYKGDDVAALGHDFKDGVCSRCEARDPNYEEPVVEPFRFDDVKDDKVFYFAPVYWAVEQKITRGTSEKLFSPNEGCTRAQVVTFLWRAAGEPEPKTTVSTFKDIDAGDYFYKAVLWAVEKGITKGTSADKFSPDATCTRGQIVTFLYRAEGTPRIAKKSKPFNDIADGQYYADAVAWAVESGVTTGKSADTFAPEATCTRGEIVTFLYRAKAE